MAQCKYYGHGYQCLWKLRGKKCRCVHCPILKEAFDTVDKAEQRGSKLTQHELNEILTKGHCNQVVLKMRQTMYDKYPAPPVASELEQVDTLLAKKEMEAVFAELYQNSDQEDD